MADQKDIKLEAPKDDVATTGDPAEHVSQQQLGNTQQALDILNQGACKSTNTGLGDVELFDSCVDTGRVVPRQNYRPQAGETIKDIATRAMGPGAQEEQVRQFLQRLMKDNHILDSNSPLNRRMIIIPEHTYVGREVNHGNGGNGAGRLRDGRATTTTTAPLEPGSNRTLPAEGNVRARVDRASSARTEGAGPTVEKKTAQPSDKKPPTGEKPPTTEKPPAAEKPPDPSKPTLSAKELDAMAKAIDKAANGGWTGIGTDKDGINEQLKRLKSPGDREELDKIYRKLTGHGIVDELKDELSGSDLTKSMELWNASNTDVARVNVALTEHKEWGWSARSNGVVEKDLRDTISTMNSDQINTLDKDYQKKHGVGIREALLNDPNLPQDTKDALEIYLKGTDKRTPEDTVKLADIALKSKNIDMFEEAFRDAKPEARKAFLDGNGKDKIQKAFGYGSEDATHALEYVNEGKLSAATKVRDNTGSVNDNEDAIELTLKNLTPDERRAYTEGKKLAAAKPEQPTEQQKKDLEYYNTLHTALGAAGNEREVMKWEDMIAVKDGGLVTKLSQHGGIIDDGMDKVLKTIEDMSEADWKRMKSDPEYAKEVRKVLAVDLNESEMQRANELLDKKLAADTFKDSQSQQRSVLESMEDETGFFNNSEEGILKAIKRMTPEEQKRYRDDEEFRKQVDEKVKGTMDEGHEQKSAFALLESIKRGEDPNKSILSKLHEHASHINTDEAKVIADLEEAFKKDPKLRERLQNDPEYRKEFEEALHGALEPYEYERYAKPIMEGGRLSMAVKAELYKGVFNDDEKEFFEAVRNGSEEDWNEILANPTETMAFLSEEEREVALNIARQKGEMRPEDKIRAAMLGGGTDETAIKEVLAELSPEETVKVKTAYLEKYGSDMMGDLLDETGGTDRTKILAEVREAPKTDREAFNQARDDVYNSVDGIGRGFVDAIDGTADMTMDDLNQYAAGMSKYSARFQEMPLEERQKYETQLGEALDLYKASESSAADMVVDGAIIAVGIAGAKFTGGVSLSLLAYTSIGGALFKVGAKSAIMGADYDFASAQVLTDAATGGIDAATIFLGPAQAAQMLKLGERSAGTAARAVLSQADDVLKVSGKQIIKEGAEEGLQKSIYEQVAFAISNGADTVNDKAIKKIAQSVAAHADDVPQVEKMIATTLNEAVKVEASNATRATLREMALNSGAGNLGGGLSGGVYGAAEWDPSRTLAENVAMVSSSTFAGATTGTLMAGGMTLGFKGLGKAFSALRGGDAPHTQGSAGDDLARAARQEAPVHGGDVADQLPGVHAVETGTFDASPSSHADGASSRVNSDTPPQTRPASSDVADVMPSTRTSDVLPGAHPEGAAGRDFEIGDLVVADGEKAILAGVDESTGRAILRFPEKSNYAGMMMPLDDASRFQPVEINGKSYLADESGHVYSVFDMGEGKKIFPKHEYKIAPLGAKIDHAPPVVQANQAIKFEGAEGVVKGFDPHTGDAIIHLPDRESYAALVKRVDNLDGYTAIPIEGHTFLRDKNGVVYETYMSGEKHMLMPVHKYRAVKQSNLEVLPHRVDDAAKTADDALLRRSRPAHENLTADADRVKAPDVPRGETYKGTPPHSYHSTDIYEGAELTLGGQPLGGVLRPDSPPIELGRKSLGLEFKGANEKVSSNHATVKWDPVEQMFYMEEHSLNGTFIKRAGEAEFTQLPGGKAEPYRVYMGPNDTIRLGSIDGPELRLNVPGGERLKPPPGPKGDVDVRIFFDGKPLPVGADGEIMIGRKHQTFGNESPSDILNRRVASNHASLKWNETAGKWEITDLTAKPRGRSPDQANMTVMVREGGNGTFIKREDGSVDFLQGDSAFLGPNDKVHLGSPDGPELRFITTEGQRQADGRVIVPRKNFDQAVKRPDGTTEITNFLNYKRLEDPHGRIIQTMDPNGARVRFDYAPDGELNRIKFDDNSVAEFKDGTWMRTAPDGKQEAFWKGEISVEDDGSMRFTDQGQPPRSTIHRIDGTTEIVHPNGRVEYTNVNFSDELSHMNRIVHTFEDKAQGARFKALMNTFETRARQTGLSAEEQALTFHHVRRLMAAEEGAFLTAPERSKLAEQILYQAGNPKVDQGFNNTCNVTTVEHRLFAKKPSEAARLISDVVMTGKYVTADGTTVDLGRIPGLLSPDNESRMLARNFDANGRDLKIDGKRSYASQIFETTAVNLQWAKSKEFNIKPGDLVVYEKPSGPKVSETGEQLVRYSVDRNGFMHRDVIGDAPKIQTHKLTDVYNSIAGTSERDFVIRHTANAPGPRTDSTYAVNSPQALKESLDRLDKQGGMPAILLVHTGHEPFFADSGAGLAGGSGGWHVVNVHGVRKDAKTGKFVVEFTNQWGQKADHMGNKAIPIEQLYKAMQDPATMPKTVQEKKGFLDKLFGGGGGDANARARAPGESTALATAAAPPRNLDSAPHSVAADGRTPSGDGMPLSRDGTPFTHESGTSRIDYHPSGEIKRVAHANGVTYNTENGVDWHVIDATAPGGSYDIRGRMAIFDNGSMEWHPEGGTRMIRNPDSSVVSFDRQTGRMESIRAADGSTVHVSLNEGNELEKVTYPNGITYATVDGTNWKVTDRTAPDGGYEVRGRMSLADDGTLTWHPEGGDVHVRKTSGETVVKRPVQDVDDEFWDLGSNRDSVDGEPRRRRMYAPERDIQKVSSDERWQLLQDIDPVRSPLNTDRAADSFIDKILPQVDGWKDLSALDRPLKESQVRYDKAVSAYQTMLDTTWDLPSQAYNDSAVAREFLKNDPEKLAVFDEYIVARTRRDIFSQHLEGQLELRRQNLENTVNEFAKEHNLPPVEVKLRDSSHMGSAKASYGDGEITLNKDDLIKKDTGASLLGSLYHELTHADQDNTVLRGLADELKVGRDYAAADIDGVVDAYRVRTGRKIDRDFVNRVLFNRSKLAELELPPEDQLRVPGLIDALKNNSPVGEMWKKSADDFRVANSALKKMTSDDPNAVITILKMMHRGDGTQTSASYNMHIFGTPEPPPEFTRYFKEFQRYFSGSDPDAWSPEVAKQARDQMRKVLTERVDGINLQRQDAYERYMQLHEKDAWVSGERARLAAVQRGAGASEVVAIDGVSWASPADLERLEQLARREKGGN